MTPLRHKPRHWKGPADLPAYLASSKAKTDEIAIWNAAVDACAKVCMDSYHADKQGRQELSYEKRIQQLAARGAFKTMGQHLLLLKIKRFKPKVTE